MKRIILFSFCVILVFWTASCGFSGNINVSRNEFYVAGQMLESAVRTLDENNKESLKAMFCSSAIENADDFDSQLDALVDYFEGDVQALHSWGSDISDPDKETANTKNVCISYDVKTSVCTYQICIEAVIADKEGSELEGIYSFYIIKADTEEPESPYRIRNGKAGIYIDVPASK